MKIKKNIIIFILILTGLTGILGYYFFQRNIYTREVLRLEILGTEEIQAFDEIEYLVRYKNNGDFVLEDPVLIFQFPENSLPRDNNLQRVEKPLENIYPGEERTISFRARIFGEENETKKAQASLRYRPKNLRAFFSSETTFTTRIKSTPLTFEFDLPSRVEPEREFQFFLNYFSNSDWPLSDLRIKIEYPSGFEFISSNPPSLERIEWELPLLNKTDGGRIEIRGKLSGEVREQRNFRANLGILQDGKFILLKEAIKGIEIARPSIVVFQRINGDSQYVANYGDLLHYEIFFRNTGEDSFQDLFLVARLEGQAFDFESVKSEFGEFNKGDNSIVWDWREIQKLRFLGPGEEGKVEFWINLKDDWQITSPQDKNFSLRNRVIISQTREEFTTKINSRLEVSQKGYFDDEVFGNSGPVPPRVGENTTYTIVWQVKNYFNDIKNATVRAVLPQEVKLTGKIFPEDARITFDSQSREIVWKIGDLLSGTGVISPILNTAFQISFIPEFNQRGQMPLLIKEAIVSGEDSWTERRLEARDSSINTTLPDDPAIDERQGIVQ